MKAIGIIPARFHSTRFPGKPLAKIGGIPMIQRVYEAAKKATYLSEVIVATDSMEIADACIAFGAPWRMTSQTCRTGTERVAEAARSIEADIIVNIQGDEPLIRETSIDQLVAAIAKGGVQISTLAKYRADASAFRDRNCVKIVCDVNHRALYFSRASIPCGGTRGLIHVGIYAFLRKTLLELAIHDRTPLEVLEDLEQLRALELGYEIQVILIAYPTVSVDVPGDIAKASLFLSRFGS